MLILNPKNNESIVIGSGKNIITVTLLKICGSQIQLGIDANSKISVHRKEIYERILRKNNSGQK